MSEQNHICQDIAAEARLLLVLLLGAAVQCREKENFILKIKSLPLDVQLSIVEAIKEVSKFFVQYSFVNIYVNICILGH